MYKKKLWPDTSLNPCLKVKALNMTRVANNRLLQWQEAMFKYFRFDPCHHTCTAFHYELIHKWCPHLYPLLLDFTQIQDMLCSLLSAYLPLLEFAHLSTVTPQSSHRLLVTDVFKHWPMSCTWRWLDTLSRLSFDVGSLVSARQPGYRQQHSGPSSTAAAAGRPTGLLLLLCALSTNDIYWCSFTPFETGSLQQQNPL